MLAEDIISDLRELSNQGNVESMCRFGINTESALGINVATLRKKAKVIGTNHLLALKIWDSGIHEARILATMIADFNKVTKKQMNSWVKDFNSWDLCDQCCNNLFRKTPFAIEYTFEWSNNREIFIKRAGFVLIAVLACHNKKMNDNDFIKYLPIIIAHSGDERNFVKKATNWALRQIGKRNFALNKKTIEVSNKLLNSESKSARWVGMDAYRELTSVKVQKLLA